MLAETSNQSHLRRSAQILGYTTLRLAMGMSMAMHGLARMPKYRVFIDGTLKLFAHSPLPARRYARSRESRHLPSC